MRNLVSGSAERPGNPIDAAEIPIVRDSDVAIGQGARPTERPDENLAQAELAARHNNTIHYNTMGTWCTLVMVALWNRADHNIFALWFLLSFFLLLFFLA